MSDEKDRHRYRWDAKRGRAVSIAEYEGERTLEDLEQEIAELRAQALEHAKAVRSYCPHPDDVRVRQSMGPEFCGLCGAMLP